MPHKKELVDLAISKLPFGAVPNCSLDDIIEEKILHEFDPQDVLDVAYQLGFLIFQCCHTGYHQLYKANGKWLEAPSHLIKKLENYNNLTHSYCPQHAQELKQKIIGRLT